MATSQVRRSHDSQPQSPEPVEERTPPVWSRRYWTGAAILDVAVFAHQIDTAQGEFTTYSVAIKRTYKVDEEYRTSRSYHPEDLPVLAQAATHAYAWISEQQQRE